MSQDIAALTRLNRNRVTEGDQILLTPLNPRNIPHGVDRQEGRSTNEQICLRFDGDEDQCNRYGDELIPNYIEDFARERQMGNDETPSNSSSLIATNPSIGSSITALSNIPRSVQDASPLNSNSL